MGDLQFDQFKGTSTYIASEELRHAVNVAVALRRPLLVRGEPGTGKTLLAEDLAQPPRRPPPPVLVRGEPATGKTLLAENLAQSLGLPLIRWHVKSTTKAKDGLYVYDTGARPHDSRFGGGGP